MPLWLAILLCIAIIFLPIAFAAFALAGKADDESDEIARRLANRDDGAPADFCGWVEEVPHDDPINRQNGGNHG